MASAVGLLVPIILAGMRVALASPTTTPVPVTTGYYHSCAIVDGGAQCWGYNHYGQIGIANQKTALVPKALIGLGSGAISMGAGY